MSDTRITFAKLTRLLNYDPETGAFTWRIGGNRRIAGARAGGQRKDGYRRICVDYIRYYEHHLAWLYMTGEWPEREIDHKNMDPSDNSFANLRSATRSQNEQNKNAPCTNTSGARGVVWDAAKKSWMAQIGHNKRAHFLGRFKNINDAIAVRRKAESEMFGEYAR